MSHTLRATNIGSMGRQLDPAAEETLIARAKGRDYESFSKIVDAYQGRIYGFVKRMIRDQEEALDVTQEVFIKAYQAFDRFDGRSSLRTWLFKIAHNLCIDRARKHDRTPHEMHLDDHDGESEAFQVPDSRWDPEAMALQSELKGVIEAALASMSEKLRTVLLLQDVEDMPYEEISALLGVPVGTVKSRIFLARAHVKNYLDRYQAGGRS